MITLHKAKVEEVFEIKRLLHETWIDTYSAIYSPQAIELVMSEWHSPELLTKQIQSPSSFFGVAKDGKKIIGMCNASITHAGNVININRIHVSPGYQRRGIGSLLIKEVIKAFPDASKVDLEVEKQNYRAFSFYQKHGFQEAGTKIITVKNVRLPCVVMEKDI